MMASMDPSSMTDVAGGPALSATERALVNILKRPTRAWVDRSRRRGQEVHAAEIAARVVFSLCRHVRDARPCRTLLIAEMVRFVDGLPPARDDVGADR